MIFYYELHFDTSSGGASKAMTLVTTELEHIDWKNFILFFLTVFIFSFNTFISLHRFRSEAHRNSLEFVFVSVKIIVVLSECLVLSAYFVTAATVSNFSSYSICFIYTTKPHHQQDVCLSEKSVCWDTFYFFYFYFFCFYTSHHCSAVYSIYVSFCS